MQAHMARTRTRAGSYTQTKKKTHKKRNKNISDSEIWPVILPVLAPGQFRPLSNPAPSLPAGATAPSEVTVDLLTGQSQ